MGYGGVAVGVFVCGIVDVPAFVAACAGALAVFSAYLVAFVGDLLGGCLCAGLSVADIVSARCVLGVGL